MATLQSWNHWSHFTRKETEVQRGQPSAPSHTAPRQQKGLHLSSSLAGSWACGRRRYWKRPKDPKYFGPHLCQAHSAPHAEALEMVKD